MNKTAWIFGEKSLILRTEYNEKDLILRTQYKCIFALYNCVVV